jgi:hypothetical protein
MSECSIYQQQAEWNEATAQAAKKGFPDWAVIMCFYAALHWVNYHACLSGKIEELKVNESVSGRTLTQHDLKKRYVQKIAREDKQAVEAKYKSPKNNQFKEGRQRAKELEDAYKLLYSASMRARYLDGLSITAKEHYSGKDIDEYFHYLIVIKERFSHL